MVADQLDVLVICCSSDLWIDYCLNMFSMTFCEIHLSWFGMRGKVPTSGVWITIPETHVPRFAVKDRTTGLFKGFCPPCTDLQDQHFALANCTES